MKAAYVDLHKRTGFQRGYPTSLQPVTPTILAVLARAETLIAPPAAWCPLSGPTAARADGTGCLDTDADAAKWSLLGAVCRSWYDQSRTLEHHADRGRWIAPGLTGALSVLRRVAAMHLRRDGHAYDDRFWIPGHSGFGDPITVAEKHGQAYALGVLRTAIRFEGDNDLTALP